MADRARAEFGASNPRETTRDLSRGAPLEYRGHWDAIMNVNAKRCSREPAVLPDDDRAEARPRSEPGVDGRKVGSRNNLPYNASKAAVVSMRRASPSPTPPTASRETASAGFRRDRHVDQRRGEQGKLMGSRRKSSLADAPIRSLGRMTPGGRRQRDRLPGLEQVELT